jgi:hypothetical protein
MKPFPAITKMLPILTAAQITNIQPMYSPLKMKMEYKFEILKDEDEGWVVKEWEASNVFTLILIVKTHFFKTEQEAKDYILIEKLSR